MPLNSVILIHWSESEDSSTTHVYVPQSTNSPHVAFGSVHQLGVHDTDGGRSDVEQGGGGVDIHLLL